MMRTSVKGKAAIMLFEGVRTRAYRDVKGVWTIGVGHTCASGPPCPHAGMELSPAKVAEVFERDLSKFEACVNDAVTVPLKQWQFDALVSLAFNIGCAAFRRSSALRWTNEGNFHLVPRGIRMWDKVTVVRNGKKVKVRSRGLARRRAMEAAMFSRAEYPRGIERIIAKYYPDSGTSRLDADAEKIVKREAAKEAVRQEVKEALTVTKAKIMGAVRHILSGVGMALVSLGYVDESTMQQLLGVAMTIAAFLWSWLAPEKQSADGQQ